MTDKLYKLVSITPASSSPTIILEDDLTATIEYLRNNNITPEGYCLFQFNKKHSKYIKICGKMPAEVAIQTVNSYDS